MWICTFFLPKEREKKNLKRWYLFLQARSKWNKVLGHTNTHWIHVVDWWLWKCRIISKVHNLVQTHCTDWAKKKINQTNQTSLGWFETLAKASSPAQVQLDKKSLWSLFTGVYLHQHGAVPREGPEGSDRGTGKSPQNYSGYSAFINMYKSITGTLKCLWLE